MATEEPVGCDKPTCPTVMKYVRNVSSETVCGEEGLVVTRRTQHWSCSMCGDMDISTVLDEKTH